MSKVIIPSPSAYETVLKNSFESFYRQDLDNWSKEPAMLFAIDFLTQQFTKLSYPTENKSLLDLGCGRGLVANQLANLGFQVTGLDLIPLAEWAQIERPDALRFVTGKFPQDFSCLQTFDVIFDNGCFHHQHPKDFPHYLQALARHTAQDGWLFLNVALGEPEGIPPGVHYGSDGRSAYFFDLAGITQIAESAGFTAVHHQVVTRTIRNLKYLFVLFRKSARK